MTEPGELVRQILGDRLDIPVGQPGYVNAAEYQAAYKRAVTFREHEADHVLAVETVGRIAQEQAAGEKRREQYAREDAEAARSAEEARAAAPYR